MRNITIFYIIVLLMVTSMALVLLTLVAGYAPRHLSHTVLDDLQFD